MLLEAAAIITGAAGYFGAHLYLLGLVREETLVGLEVSCLTLWDHVAESSAGLLSDLSPFWSGDVATADFVLSSPLLPAIINDEIQASELCLAAGGPLDEETVIWRAVPARMRLGARIVSFEREVRGNTLLL